MNDAELDEKLARLGRRLGTEREKVREALRREPELLALAEACRARFNARLRWVRIGDFERGRPPEW